MRIACIQMDVVAWQPDRNFDTARRLTAEAMKGAPDVIMLPEAWNTGFGAREKVAAAADRDGARTKTEMGELASSYGVNIVAGSVIDLRGDALYNTAYIFDRRGDCIAAYDKIHLFTPSGEAATYAPGGSPCRVTLDGAPCGVATCYDIRFPELARTLAVAGMDVLFVPTRWPEARMEQLEMIMAARAVENEVFVVRCDAALHPGRTMRGGRSAVLDPMGRPIALAGAGEEIIFADCDLDSLPAVRSDVPVFHDRRPDTYSV